jgi:hypothetical protein
MFQIRRCNHLDLAKIYTASQFSQVFDFGGHLPKLTCYFYKFLRVCVFARGSSPDLGRCLCPFPTAGPTLFSSVTRISTIEIHQLLIIKSLQNPSQPAASSSTPSEPNLDIPVGAARRTQGLCLCPFSTAGPTRFSYVTRISTTEMHQLLIPKTLQRSVTVGCVQFPLRSNPGTVAQCRICLAGAKNLGRLLRGFLFRAKDSACCFLEVVHNYTANGNF